MTHTSTFMFAMVLCAAHITPAACKVVDITSRFDGRQGSAAFVDTTPAARCQGGTCAAGDTRLIDMGITVSRQRTGHSDAPASLGMSIPAGVRKVTVSDGRHTFEASFQITAQGFELTGPGLTRDMFVNDGLARPNGDCQAAILPASGTLVAIWTSTAARASCTANIKPGMLAHVQQRVSLAYRLGLPSPLKIPAGVYQGEVRYAIGPGQDLDYADGVASDAEVVFRLTLSVEHALRLDFSRASNAGPLEVELVPPGGWLAWPRGRVPLSVGADVPFQLSLTGPARVYLRCQDAGRCQMRSGSGDTVAIVIGASMPGVVTAPGQQSIQNLALPIGEAAALVIAPATAALQSQPSVLHVTTHGPLIAGQHYDGEAVLVLDAD